MKLIWYWYTVVLELGRWLGLCWDGIDMVLVWYWHGTDIDWHGIGMVLVTLLGLYGDCTGTVLDGIGMVPAP